jgi:hypothetical protein
METVFVTVYSFGRRREQEMTRYQLADIARRAREAGCEVETRPCGGRTEMVTRLDGITISEYIY